MTRKERLIRDAILTGRPVAQVAALPWRKMRPAPGLALRHEVLLITSRRHGRWILPKGWPIRRRNWPEAAAIEAWQEAGVLGRIGTVPLGWFQCEKRFRALPEVRVPVIVTVYPLRVSEVATDWKEKHQRRRRWVPMRSAADLVTNGQLALLMRQVLAGRA